ncbi:MAG: iron chelate uptake ABC transporter family permease subunit [Alphaproteobacteria bacterium]
MAASRDCEADDLEAKTAASSRGPAIRRPLQPGPAALVVLSLALLVCFILSIGWGAVPIAPRDVLMILLDALGLPVGAEILPRDQAVVLAIRLPRALLGLAVGAGLAIAGAAMQGLFRNPLADPALIGVSTGAALGAVAMIVAGSAVAGALAPALRPFALPVAAFVGGLLVTLIVQRIATRDGVIEIPTMLLAGIAVNALASALLGVFTFASDDQQLRELTFWLMGSLAAITWSALLPALALILLPALILRHLAGALNAMLLGEAEAHYLGFDVDRTKRLTIILTALITGAGVAVSGVIGFVGLVTPHLIRLAIGPDHRSLLPASALLGGCLLLLADMAARTVVLPAELPIGIVTASVGGPFFLWLLARRRGLSG